ncbi:MAG: DinB family protein [Nevskiales bacterium]
MLHAGTLNAMAAFPDQLQVFFEAVPAGLLCWTPASWDGVPSESLTALEQVCHLRDIEIEGYQPRFRRLLEETNPLLPAIDGYALVRARNYAQADAGEALAAFRAARSATVGLLRSLSDEQLLRRGIFEDYGPVTLRGMAHYLCSHDQQHLAGLQWLLGKMQQA